MTGSLASDFDLVDGSLLQRFRYQASEGYLYIETVDLEERLILEENAKMRASPELARPMDGFGDRLRFPPLHLEAWKQMIPELDSPDRDIRERAWARFKAAPESAPYRVPWGAKTQVMVA